MNIEKPYRQKQTATIEIGAKPDDVFTLMCPVREYEWVPGWITNRIISSSGLVEEGCIFTTPAAASEGGAADGNEAIWVTPVHDPENRRLMMIKVTPKTCVTRLDIAVEETASGCAATISYEHTALSETGRALVDTHTEDEYRKTMDGWKDAIEGYLGRD